MCGGGGSSYDYGAAKAAADAETAKLQAEKELEERKAELQAMQEKESQAAQEAAAKAARRDLLTRSLAGDETDDEEDLLKPTTRSNSKKTQSILKDVE